MRPEPSGSATASTTMAVVNASQNDSLDALLARQAGVLTRAQALAGGMSGRQVERRLARGAWRALQRGVYAHASFPRTWEQRLVAATLAAGPRAAVSHRAALIVWGLHGFTDRSVEISVASRSPRLVRGAIVHRMPDLGRGEVTRRGNLPITTPARTLVDLGAVVPAGIVERCLEEWLADRRVTVDQLRAVVRRHAVRGRRGVGVLRAALEERVLGDLVADSGAEALLARVLAERGLPAPVHHHLVRAGGDVVAELDYAYPPALVALEVDGYGVHLRSRAAFAHDRHRQNELEIAGWRFLRFTSDALRADPDRVADQVARMLASTARKRSFSSGRP